MPFIGMMNHQSLGRIKSMPALGIAHDPPKPGDINDYKLFYFVRVNYHYLGNL